MLQGKFLKWKAHIRIGVEQASGLSRRAARPALFDSAIGH